MVIRYEPSSMEPFYAGLRMTADEFLALPESTDRYELVDGVVVMAPAASFGHQRVAAEVLYQIRRFLETHALGEVVGEVDVRLAEDIVYRPDVVFLETAKARRAAERIAEPPELVVEIVSPSSRRRDTAEKRADYEAAGVREYWLIDPERESFVFLTLNAGVFREAPATPDRYASAVLRGFELDLDAIRRLF